MYGIHINRKDVCHMADYSTKKLFDMFFDSLGKDEDTIRKIRPQIDRDEVYEYENKVGKQLVELDVDELFEMILSFNGNRNFKNAPYSISYSSYNQIASLYRSFFSWYIDNIKVIKNPFNDKRMKGTAATRRLAKYKEVFTKEKMDEIIYNLHQDFETDRADYFECIIRLFYDGFSDAPEIVELTEDMIDFKNKVVRLYGRTINFTDRTFELLLQVHDSFKMIGWRGDYDMDSWHGKYFKYPVRPRHAEKLQDKPASEIAALINRFIITNVKNKYGIDVNYRTFYMLGFYEYLKEYKGEERTKELILTMRDRDATTDLLNAARRYGLVFDNVTQLKRALQPYVPRD